MQYKDPTTQQRLTLISLDVTDDDDRRRKDMRMMELIDQGYLIASQADVTLHWYAADGDFEPQPRRVFQAVLYHPTAVQA